ncbi:acid protease [Daldinia bambusicola]|nr:acid protease [Daldinia bambusicola]
MAGFPLQLLTSFLALSLGAAAVPVDHLLETRNFAAEADLAITENYDTLLRIQRRSELSRALDARRRIRRNKVILDELAEDSDGSKDADILAKGFRQNEYVVKVRLGGKEFYMAADTGSADTWIAADGFTCLALLTGQEVPQTDCGFGPLFRGDFPDGKLDNINLNVSYENGEYINGPMGFANLTINNLTVPKQQFALVDVAAFQGDEASSGILGLGLRGLTQAFRGNDPGRDTIADLVNYPPLVENMGTSKATKSILGFALSRDEERSYISFGGVPPVKTGEYVTVPIEKGKFNGKTDYFFYEVAVDSIVWNSSTVAQEATDIPHMVVDSATTINLFPLNVATDINKAFKPAAKRQQGSSIWTVECDAVPPTLDIVIGGKAIRTSPRSMVIKETADDGSVQCLSGIGAGREGSYILGDTFMEEIVAVFDASDKMMKFAQRTD